VRSRFADIKDDLAILDVFARHADTIDRRVYHDVRSVLIVPHPFVHGANQIGTF